MNVSENINDVPNYIGYIYIDKINHSVVKICAIRLFNGNIGKIKIKVRKSIRIRLSSISNMKRKMDVNKKKSDGFAFGIIEGIQYSYNDLQQLSIAAQYFA